MQLKDQQQQKVEVSGQMRNDLPLAHLQGKYFANGRVSCDRKSKGVNWETFHWCDVPVQSAV